MKGKVSISILILVMCFLLTACNGKSTLKSDKNVPIDNSMQITDKLEYPVRISIGTKCIVDLNNDDCKDSISYIVCTEKAHNEKSITSINVNNIEYKDKIDIKGLGICDYIENPNSEWYYITDIDQTDNFREIAIVNNGPDDQPVTLFLRYDGQKLNYIGSMSGCPNDLTCKFEGNGTIISKGRLSVLQTWWAPMKWSLDRDGKLEFVNEDMYYPYNSNDNGSKQVLLKDFYVYKRPDLKAEQIELSTGSKITFTSTDNEHWVCLKNEDGIEGWFYVEDFRYILQKGKQVESTSIFGNLGFAG